MNGRPVDVPVIAKAVNEVYKSFNTHQLPVVVLDFSVPRGTSSVLSLFLVIDAMSIMATDTDHAESVDINVSPDKRSIFLHSEAQLIEALKVCSPRPMDDGSRRLLKPTSNHRDRHLQSAGHLRK
jgi:DNA mismatch repair protein PMS2